jgi:hypothetical protein
MVKMEMPDKIDELRFKISLLEILMSSCKDSFIEMHKDSTEELVKFSCKRITDLHTEIIALERVVEYFSIWLHQKGTQDLQYNSLLTFEFCRQIILSFDKYISLTKFDNTEMREDLKILCVDLTKFNLQMVHMLEKMN